MTRARLRISAWAAVSCVGVGWFWASLAWAACDYTVTVPGPADIWNAGSVQNIQWFKSGTCSDRVDLHLLRDDKVAWTIATNQVNNGTASWSIPNQLPTALEYRIRVRDRDDSDSVGLSATFTILNSGSCGYRITEPAGGDEWYLGTRQTIRWSRAGNCPSPVDLHLLFRGQQVVEIARGVSDIGSYIWDVPSFLDDSDQYSVRIRDANDRNAYDTSGTFSIEEAPECQYEITQPTSSTTWRTGETVSVAWISDGVCGQLVDVHLLRGGSVADTIAAGLEDAGTAEWTVPGDLTPGTDYTVRVRDTDLPDVLDVSELFAIERSTPEPETSVHWFEIAARVEGQAGSVWRTDVVLKNLSDTDAKVVLELHGDGGGTVDSVVAANAQGVFEDVLGLMEVEGKGWIEVNSDQPLLVSGRIYNLGDEGTFGQYLEGYPEGAGLDNGESGWLLQLRQQVDRFRTNLTFTNPYTQPAAVRVTLFDAAGRELLRYSIELDSKELLQDLEPFRRRAGKPDLGWGFAMVEVLEGSSVLVSASVVDSRTNDATTVPVKRASQ